MKDLAWTFTESNYLEISFLPNFPTNLCSILLLCSFCLLCSPFFFCLSSGKLLPLSKLKIFIKEKKLVGKLFSPVFGQVRKPGLLEYNSNSLDSISTADFKKEKHIAKSKVIH